VGDITVEVGIGISSIDFSFLVEFVSSLLIGDGDEGGEAVDDDKEVKGDVLLDVLLTGVSEVVDGNGLTIVGVDVEDGGRGGGGRVLPVVYSIEFLRGWISNELFLLILESLIFEFEFVIVRSRKLVCNEENTSDIFDLNGGGLIDLFCKSESFLLFC